MSPATGAFLDKLDVTIGGMSSGVPPTLLSPQQVAMSVNITHRGGKPSTRPGMWKLNASYVDETEYARATQARFQGAGFYKGFGSNANCLLASIGGRIFRYLINNQNVKIQELQADKLNDPTLKQAWLWQGQDFMVINDGQSDPLFFDGASLRRSKGYVGSELPAGRMGHYCNGRIAMALPDGQSWIAGDLVYSTASGTAPYNYRDSILKITENQNILQGRAFGVPIESGAITAMFSVAIPDTSLGQGPLQVGTENGIFSVNLPLDATLWNSIQQPSQTVSLPNGGPVSQTGVTTVNGDAWYRAADGLRSFVTARRDFNTWVQTPLSFEMEQVLAFDTQALLAHTSSVTFQNRLLTTCSPYNVEERGFCHRGLVALDFNNISSLTSRSNPDYDGVWTGLPVLQILKGKFDGRERCFLFALDGQGRICLYELMADGTSTADYTGLAARAIESWLLTGALFGRVTDPSAVGLPLKKLITTDLFFEKLAGIVAFRVSYTSDQYPCLIDWKAFQVCSQTCVTSCPEFIPPKQQYATYMRLPEPADDCSELTGRLKRTGYSFQIKVQWSGHAGLQQMLTWAMPMRETLANVCPSNECKTIQCCGPDLFTYVIETTD